MLIYQKVRLVNVVLIANDETLPHIFELFQSLLKLRLIICIMSEIMTNLAQALFKLTTF